MGVVSKNWLLTVLMLLLFSTNAPFAVADIGEEIRGLGIRCMETFKHLTIGTLVDNPQNRELKLTLIDTPNSTLNLQLRKRLGYGMNASVFPIAALSGLETLEGRSDLVLKMPHRFLGKKILTNWADNQVEREVEIYDALLSIHSKLESDKYFPKNPSWEKGALPTLPILAKLKTNRGIILIKPFLSGLTLREIKQKYNPKNLRDLPPEMLASLKDIYNFTQAVFNHARITRHPNSKEYQEVRLDINANNMVWIDDPAQMKSLGLKRPSFYFYEFGYTPTRIYHRNSMTLENYLRTTIDFIRVAK